MSTGAFVGVIAGYLVLDRFFIDHVQGYAPVPSAQTSASAAASASPLSPGAASSAASASVGGEVTWDDWKYTSDHVRIEITKHSTGTGSNTVTYYVADVQVTGEENLQSAFANDQFGLNITRNTSVIAKAHHALLAINGDYYGFRQDGGIIRNGLLCRNVPVRMAAAIFQDGHMEIIDEKAVSAASLLKRGVTDTFSFGPALVIDGVVQKDFANVMIDSTVMNRAIEGLNPRTGFGMIAPNYYVFVVVDGRSSGYSKGMTLQEFAQLFKDLGCTQAYNLDGGGSSTMIFMDRLVNLPQGRTTERGTSDILFVGE
ncbi:MAG TPA: exopolysaccharide biosynthesis protein [Clostridiales bacterium]|nr:exopolysaccharide biosynthesis protein [Clostridiales bacterium]